MHACMQRGSHSLDSPLGAFTLGNFTAVVEEMCCTCWVTGAGGGSSAATAAPSTTGEASKAPADRDNRASWLRPLFGAWCPVTAAVDVLHVAAAVVAARLARGVGAMVFRRRA